MQIKILFNVSAYPETKGERPTTPAKEIDPKGIGVWWRQFGKHLW